MLSLLPPSIDIDTEELFRFSYATAAIFALLVIEISTDIGEYLRLLDQKRTTKKEKIERKLLILKSSYKAIILATSFLIVSGIILTLKTQRMDWRMVIILNGLSRLEASTILFFVSVKTPCWTGMYHSPSGTKRLYLWSNASTDADDLLSNLQYYVMKSIFELYTYAYFLLLPFVGHPISFLCGVCIGLCIDICIFYARRSKNIKWITISLASILAISSTILFTSGCIYIKMVWNIHWFNSKWGLAATAFILWSIGLCMTHYTFWKRTETMILNGINISRDAAYERLATSMYFSLRKINTKDSFQSNHDDTQSLSTINSIEEDEPLSKFYTFFYLLLILTTLASIFISIVNIGATRQMNIVRQKFPIVHAKFYQNMNHGPVCAMLPTKEIKTFPDQYSVPKYYRIIHCGACSSCSNYHNLRLQYTTRKTLAADAAMCARKSLYLGREAVHRCLMETPSIGFSGDCAMCWTDDIYCARDNCAFIFLQSMLINKVSNFEVGPEDITSATCEEANCELDFVPCSGANRRRMNIVSDIERPKDQQCTIVQFDWEELFFGEDEGTQNIDFSTSADEL